MSGVSADADIVGVICGPTAAGKSAVASVLAEYAPTAIISADSRQIYRGFDIGTAKPTATERARVEHHGIDIIDPTERYSAAAWAEEADRWIEGARGRRVQPIVVGGTGLYLRAALSDLELPPPPAPGTRERFEGLYDELGPEAAHELLAARDPAAAAAVHPNDRRRVVRALELTEAGSSLRPGEDRLWSGETRHPTRIVGLDVPAEELERRIDDRTRGMFERGVEAEVRLALAGPISQTARTIHGLSDVAELPPDEATEAIVIRTRRYAAYQRKWMRRIPGLVPVDASRPPGEVAQEIVDRLGSVAR